MYQLPQKSSSITPYIPVDSAGCIRLDANESFLPLPRELLEELCRRIPELEMNRYPDPAAAGLCRAFAAHYHVDPGLTVAGNGSDELISVIFQAFLEKGGAFATLEPDFSMYAQSGALCQARHVPIVKPNFRIDVEETAEVCGEERVRLLIFSNPCNPTSIVLDRERVRWLARELSEIGCLMVLDEAYMDFSDQSLLREVEEHDNLIILRTCSKALGMAAARLGFAVANGRLARVIQAAKAPYNVNAISQELGALVLSRPLALRRALEEIRSSMAQLREGLRRLCAKYPGELEVLPGETNFAALLTGHDRLLQQRLLGRGIAVRYTGGLLRVSCGKEQENRAFLEALDEMLGEL